MKLSTLFPTKTIIGVVHLLPLPGTPKFSGDKNTILARALREASIYQDAKVDGIIIENFNDEPFSTADISREQMALMSSIVGQVRREVSIPIGVNVHFNDWQAELAICYVCDAEFARVEVFVDTVVTVSGIVEPCCAQVTRYRKLLGAENDIAIFADVHPKYSRNLLPTTLEESAQMARDSLADALIVTGYTTGEETPLEDIRKVKGAADLPVFVGSGTTSANVGQILAIADGAIVGSAFKHNGNVHNEIDVARLNEFMAAAR